MCSFGDVLARRQTYKGRDCLALTTARVLKRTRSGCLLTVSGLTADGQYLVNTGSKLLACTSQFHSLRSLDSPHPGLLTTIVVSRPDVYFVGRDHNGGRLLNNGDIFSLNNFEAVFP